MDKFERGVMVLKMTGFIWTMDPGSSRAYMGRLAMGAQEERWHQLDLGRALEAVLFGR